MSGQNLPNQKEYGAYKVSEYTHGDGKSKGKGYRVDESSGVPARAEIPSNNSEMDELEKAGNFDFNKKHKLGKDGKNMKAEYKSTRDALRELNPFRLKK